MNRRSAVRASSPCCFGFSVDRAQERRRRELEPDERAEEVQHLGDLIRAHHALDLVREPQPRRVVGVRRQLEADRAAATRSPRAASACRRHRARPRRDTRATARSPVRGSSSISSLISRVLPVPWLPTIVTSCGAWKSIARATTSRSVASASSRPTSALRTARGGSGSVSIRDHAARTRTRDRWRRDRSSDAGAGGVAVDGGSAWSAHRACATTRSCDGSARTTT